MIEQLKVIIAAIAVAGAFITLAMYGQMMVSDWQCGPNAELIRLFPRKLCVLR